MHIVFYTDPVSYTHLYQSLKADFRWWFLEEEPAELTPAVVNLTAEKVLDGKFARGSEFTFELKDPAGKLIQLSLIHI